MTAAGIKLGLGAVLLAAIVGWCGVQWERHNHAEQTLGQVQCEQKTSAAADVQVEQTASTTAGDIATLQKAAADYEQKISDLRGSNADLAQRLHDERIAAAKLRSSAVSAVSGSAAGIPAATNDAAPSDGDRQQAEDLEACAANTIELNSIREAWIALAKKRSEPKAR